MILSFFLEQILLLLYRGTHNTAYCRSLPALSIQVPFMSLLACYWWAVSCVADNQLINNLFMKKKHPRRYFWKMLYTQTCVSLNFHHYHDFTFAVNFPVSEFSPNRASFSSQNSLKSSWHGFHKLLKAFLWDSVPCWYDCNFCRFVSCTFIANLPFYHIPKVFYWIQIRCLQRPLKNIELIFMSMKPAWDDLCFVTSCVMLDVVLRKWVHCDHGEMHMVSNNTQIGCGIQAMIDWY